MIDPRFFTTKSSLSCNAISTLTNTVIRQAQTSPVMISHVADYSSVELAGAAIFLGDVKRLEGMRLAKPAICFATVKVIEALQANGLMAGAGLLESDNPKAAHAVLASHLHESIAETRGFMAQETSAYDGDGSQVIHATAIIAASAHIGKDVWIGPGTYIGPGVVIGQGSRIGANATLTHCVVGCHCSILAGAVIGEAGFGFVSHKGKQIRVPQLGIVEIGDHVEIGANTTIDRGALQNTKIGDETKIDNLVQIAHNVVMGKGCAIASQTGISGSCIIGDGVLMGGQAGIADHVLIGHGAIVSAGAGLMKNIPDGERWGGMPAKPARQWMKETAALSRLAKKK